MSKKKPKPLPPGHYPAKVLKVRKARNKKMLMITYELPDGRQLKIGLKP